MEIEKSAKKKLEKTHKNVAQQQLEMGVVCGPGRGQQCGTGGMLSICSSFDCSFFRSFVVCLLHLTRTANKTKKRQQNSRNEQSLSLCFTTVSVCVCVCVWVKQLALSLFVLELEFELS